MSDESHEYFLGRKPNIGDYLTRGSGTVVYTQNGWVPLEVTEVVELTPYTTTLLYHAWYAEDARIRHEAELWHGQAMRDVANREMWRQKAIEAGVPEHQADRYINWKGPTPL